MSKARAVKQVKKKEKGRKANCDKCVVRYDLYLCRIVKVDYISYEAI